MMEATFMKNNLIRGRIAVTLLIPCFLSCSKMNPPSRFLNNFSLGETIKQMNLQGIELPSGETTKTASAGDPSPYRNVFHLSMIIPDSMAGKFDERDFLAKLEEKIRREVVDTGSKISGGGGSEGNFHIEYENGKQKGGIEVIGVRSERTGYELWCIIRELAANGGSPN